MSTHIAPPECGFERFLVSGPGELVRLNSSFSKAFMLETEQRLAFDNLVTARANAIRALSCVNSDVYSDSHDAHEAEYASPGSIGANMRQARWRAHSFATRAFQSQLQVRYWCCRYESRRATRE